MGSELLLIYTHKAGRAGEIGALYRIPNCIFFRKYRWFTMLCSFLLHLWRLSFKLIPKRTWIFWIKWWNSQIFSPQENFRTHLSSNQKCVQHPLSFPNRRNWASRTLPNVVLFFSHSSLACVSLFESISNSPKGSSNLAPARHLTDKRTVDKPSLALALSMLWSLIWMVCSKWGSSNPVSASEHNR